MRSSIWKLTSNKFSASWKSGTDAAQGELDAVLGLLTEDAVFPQMYKPSHDEEEIRSRFREWAGRARNREQVRGQRYPCVWRCRLPMVPHFNSDDLEGVWQQHQT